MDRRRTYYDQWSAVYSGDRRSLMRTGDRDSFWRRPGKAKLHVPIAADIAAISAELLFGEEVRFQISCMTGFGDPAEKNRRLSEIASRSGLQARLSEAAERAAANMPIQGTEADLMKRAMINVDKALPTGAELVMQVHDSLIVECDENIAKDIAKILQQQMESVAPELKIKLAVDVTIGHNWGEL